MKLFVAAMLIACSTTSVAQDVDGLPGRLRGYTPGDSVYYFNADGVDVECVMRGGEFTASNVTHVFKEKGLKPKRLKADPGLGRQNFYEPGELLRAPNVYSTLDYYFVGENKILYAFTFTSTHEISQEFERALINLFLDDKMPGDIYQPKDMNQANFAGHILDLSGECPRGGCSWLGSTDLRARYTHLMWSLFGKKERAELDRTHHLHYLEIAGNTILDKGETEIQFEGQQVSATKVYFLSAPTQIGRFNAPRHELVAYIIVAPVSGNYVTCVVIHDMKDPVTENGVPEIASQIMKL